MNFDQIYPNAQAGFENEQGFMKGRHVLDCIACGEPTNWFHRGLRLYFCSQKCFDRYQQQGSMDQQMFDRHSGWNP